MHRRQHVTEVLPGRARAVQAPREFRVHDIYLAREELGEFATLMPKLLADPVKFF